MLGETQTTASGRAFTMEADDQNGGGLEKSALQK